MKRVWTAIAVALGMIAAVGPPAFARSPASQTGNSLRVMTYNVRYDDGKADHAWADRLPVMADLIHQARPDVFDVQEPVEHQMTDLADNMPGFGWVGVAGEGGTVHPEYVGVFYRQSRLALQKSGNFWLSDTPSVPNSATWGNTIPRMVTWALFEDRKDHREFYVYNTHFDCDTTCGDSIGAQVRLKSAQLIASRTAHLRHPVILTGDFNDIAGTAASYKYLTQDAGFGDTWQEAERRGPIVGTYNDYQPPSLGGDRLDWILRRGQVRTTQQRIDTYGDQDSNYPSDHLPVIADVLIGQKPRGPVHDKSAPARVTGLTASAPANMVELAWNAGSDNIGVESYNVYASTDPVASPSRATLIANVPGLSYRHLNLGLAQTWYYHVAAVDRRGNIGEPSTVAPATTDSSHILFEAEAGLPLLPGSADARSQFNCCHITWSGDHQLLVTSAQVADTAAFTLPVVTAGTFDLSLDITHSYNFADWTVSIDGKQIGEPYDAYGPAVALVKGVDFGPVDLTSGDHTVTFTVTGKNSESGGYAMGIDALHLTLTS